MRPPLTGLLVAALLVPALVPALGIGPVQAAPAQTDRVSVAASPVGDAKARAAALRVAVDQLREQAEVATEDYNASYAQLGEAVTAHLSAQRDLDAAARASTVTDDQASRRVRALYMSGGVPALYAKVLDSTTITEVAARVHQVGVVLDGDRRDSAAADRAVALRRDAEQRLQRAAEASTALQREVADRGDVVRALLARTDAMLASADARVLALAEAQRVAREQAAARRAAVVLRRAAANVLDLPSVPASPQAAAALAFARAQLGAPYLWGATGPSSYDCSGLTGAAWAAAGVHLPRTSRQQWFAGPHVTLADLQPGDLLFWANDLSDPGTIHHVALYAGDGLMVAAPHTGDVVKVQQVYLDGYLGAVRPGVGAGDGPAAAAPSSLSLG